MTKRQTAILFFGALTLAFTFGPSEATAAGMMMHHHHQDATTKTPSSTQAYKHAMMAMHQRMQPLSGNPDVDFVRQMIPHHQAAVDMARIQLAYGHDEALKSFSRWVIIAQEQEIGFMQNWLRGHDNGRAASAAVDYYGKAMKKMHGDMMIDYTGDADVDFVRSMIPHHQGAVDMAGIWLSQGTNPELRSLVNGIFSAQSYEIAWQRNWLAHRNEHLSFPSFIF